MGTCALASRSARTAERMLLATVENIGQVGQLAQASIVGGLARPIEPTLTSTQQHKRLVPSIGSDICVVAGVHQGLSAGFPKAAGYGNGMLGNQLVVPIPDRRNRFSILCSTHGLEQPMGLAPIG